MLSTPGITPRRISAFRVCGYDAYVMARGRVVIQHDSYLTANGEMTATLFGKEYRIRCTKCHDRFCVPCANERASVIRSALLDHMKDKSGLKLVTLTLRNVPTTLRDALNRITRHFRTLREKPLWKKAITGGVWIIESKVGDGSGQWHVHVHCIAEGKFLNKFDLSALWHSITGDSKIVDVEAVGARTGAVHYVTKYVTKAADASIVNDPARLKEAIVAFTGRRLISTFGSWRGLQLSEVEDEDFLTYLDPQDGLRYPKPEWRPVGPLDAIITAAAAGNPTAQFILAKLKRGSGPGPPHGVRQLPSVQV